MTLHKITRRFLVSPHANCTPKLINSISTSIFQSSQVFPMSPEIETATWESQRPLRWPSNTGCSCCLRLGSSSHGEKHGFKENEQMEQVVAYPVSPSNRHCHSDSENPYRHIMHGSRVMLALLLLLGTLLPCIAADS